MLEVETTDESKIHSDAAFACEGSTSAPSSLERERRLGLGASPRTRRLAAVAFLAALAGASGCSGTPVAGDGGTLDDGGVTVDSGSGCGDTQTDPMHCGSCDHACATVEHGAATCTDMVCGFTCDPGYAPVMGACAELEAPRPIAPLSTATATSRRPTFRWELAPGTDGAQVEVCADRACDTVVATFTATGDRGAPSADLPQGLSFWRLRGTNGDYVGVTPSPTWELLVGARSAPADTSWGTRLDIDGDGYFDWPSALPTRAPAPVAPPSSSAARPAPPPART